METEEKIVYAIITIVEKQRNEDFKISERAIRAFLQQYRSALIAEYSSLGLEVSEECFQYLGEWEYSQTRPGSREYATTSANVIPKVVRLKDNMGLMLEKNGYNIPVVTSQDYSLSLGSLLSSHHPKAKYLGDKMTLYIGRKKSDCAHTDELNMLVDDFETESSSFGQMKVTCTLHAILDNPSQAPGYDWTINPYPLNSELIKEVKTRVLAEEFNIILQVKGDKVTNLDDESIKE